MPLLTPALTDASALLHAAPTHLAASTCLTLIRPQTRLQALTLNDALATTRYIDEIQHMASLAASDALGDLANLHHLLATHRDCHTCVRLRHDAARIHHDLAQHT